MSGRDFYDGLASGNPIKAYKELKRAKKVYENVEELKTIYRELKELAEPYKNISERIRDVPRKNIKARKEAASTAAREIFQDPKYFRDHYGRFLTTQKEFMKKWKETVGNTFSGIGKLAVPLITLPFNLYIIPVNRQLRKLKKVSDPFDLYLGGIDTQLQILERLGQYLYEITGEEEE